MNNEYSIVNYFDSTCRIIIDEFNLIFNTMSLNERRNYANYKICENDLVNKLGRSFANLARYPSHETRGRDIIIDYKQFEVEVKYWRNWNCNYGINKLRWESSFYSALNWLCNEIDNGNKNKRTIICGWCTIFSWNQLLQLGNNTGKNPKVNTETLHMLPFLNCTDDTISSIKTRYDLRESSFRILGKNSILNWRLLGSESDNFNMVIFW